MATSRVDVRTTLPAKWQETAMQDRTGLQSGDLLNIFDIDSDGDFSVDLLADAGFAQLRFPSRRYWLLSRNCNGKVELWLPPTSSTAEHPPTGPFLETVLEINGH